MSVCLFQTGDIFTKTLLISEIYTILFHLKLNVVEN